MERIRTLTSTLVATLLYLTSIGVEAKVLSCEATKGNGRGWIPTEFKIDVSNDRKTANVISPVTDVFGAKPFEKSFLGSSLWSRGKGKSKMGDYYNYQLRLDLDSNDTEAKIVMTMQGYHDNELRFRCVAGGSSESEPPNTGTQANNMNSASPSICRNLMTEKSYSDGWSKKVQDLSIQALCRQFDIQSSLFKMKPNPSIYAKQQLGSVCRELSDRGVDCTGQNSTDKSPSEIPVISWFGNNQSIEIDYGKKEIRYFAKHEYFDRAYVRAKRGEKLAVGLTTYPSKKCTTAVRDGEFTAYEVTPSVRDKYIVFPLQVIGSELFGKADNDLGIVVYLLAGGTYWVCSDWDLDRNKADWPKLKQISTSMPASNPLESFGSIQLRSVSDETVCDLANSSTNRQEMYLRERKARGLDCVDVLVANNVVIDTSTTQVANSLMNESDLDVCYHAVDTFLREPSWSKKFLKHVEEAKQRKLSPEYCQQLRLDVAEESRKDSYVSKSEGDVERQIYSKLTDEVICSSSGKPFKREADRRGLSCNRESRQPSESTEVLSGSLWAGLSDDVLCMNVASDQTGQVRAELNKRDADCGLSDLDGVVSEENTSDSAIEIERLKQRLAQLESRQKTEQQAISQDTQSPSIRITASNSDGARGTISGVASDNTGIAEVLIDGQAVAVDSGGRFTTSTFIPSGGIDIQITAYDLKGLSTTETVRLERSKRTQTVSRLAAVNPLVGPKQKSSRDRVALIIGVEDYARAPSADFASGDAKMFADYAREKLGVADNNIKILSDTGASKAEILRALKVWLPKAVKPDTTDLYVFYAGHGMPTADGTSAYLVPYDGDIQLLEDTAISRKRFFDEISATKPRSATFFFDNCFSGATRSEELLLASRPLGIKVQETNIPDNYLVFAAGETDQIAGVEPEVKYGRFSYFVFKGLEGEADANQDGKISAGELHKYVRESVGRFSAGAQTPTMLGDVGRWVVK